MCAADVHFCHPLRSGATVLKKPPLCLGYCTKIGYLVNLDMDKKAVDRRAFLGMYFKCCRVYSRIYINRQQTAFVGWCPRCAAKVEVKISPAGSDSRFFVAG